MFRITPFCFTALAIESIGEDLSLEEAIVRLRELTRQNEELRSNLQTMLVLLFVFICRFPIREKKYVVVVCGPEHIRL